MNKQPRKRIPVNLIAGTLGVGKTTTINHLLEQRPQGERWAVLVNEYGLVGLDAALMKPEAEPGQPSGVEIREIAGGCICCSAGFMFDVSLVLLLQRKPDRLLIEPTGLAALSGILDTLDREGICESIDVRSVVCLLDPARFQEDLERDEVQDQIEAADVLLASRSDLATPEQLATFDQWAKSLFPAKPLVTTIENGQVPLDWLDLIHDRRTVVPRRGHQHGTDHHHDHNHDHDHHHDHNHDHDHHHDHNHDHDHDHAQESVEEILCDASTPIVQQSHHSSSTSTIGWVCWEGLTFDAERSSAWLRRLAQLPGGRRIKAVLRTNEGWRGFNLADGAEAIQPSGHRRDSRLEFVIESDQFPAAEVLEIELRACLIVNSSD